MASAQWWCACSTTHTLFAKKQKELKQSLAVPETSVICCQWNSTVFLTWWNVAPLELDVVWRTTCRYSWPKWWTEVWKGNHTSFLIYAHFKHHTVILWRDIEKVVHAGADPEIFQRGGGLRRKMFVDARINVCTHKNQTNMQLFLSPSFSRGLSSIFCFNLLLSLIFEILKRGGGATPVPPPSL